MAEEGLGATFRHVHLNDLYRTRMREIVNGVPVDLLQVPKTLNPKPSTLNTKS
jgi:hypothetical protein